MPGIQPYLNSEFRQKRRAGSDQGVYKGEGTGLPGEAEVLRVSVASLWAAFFTPFFTYHTLTSRPPKMSIFLITLIFVQEA